MDKPHMSADDFLKHYNKPGFCDNCGEKLVDKDDKFCHSCGKNFESNEMPEENNTKIIIGSIVLIAIIIVGGYFAYSTYQTSEFDKNYKNYMANTLSSYENLKSGNDVYVNEYSSIYTANYIELAINYNNLAIDDLEECKKYAQTSEEKELIELSLNLAKKNEQYLDASYNFWEKASSITYSSNYIWYGASSSDSSQLTDYYNQAEKYSSEVEDLRNNLAEFLDNHPELKERFDM
ncbi:hypothetical protein LJB96_00380 [Methanobrevibacter sp. OttesenSCG-928-K11]|nr:hypothetical protein [Methanobrevibacter sp. OttesenSCG-928-K11]MDL2270826.1 hypothetical protein [Methanobrevibacter sp. OttesenSCG-928-I08]